MAPPRKVDRTRHDYAGALGKDALERQAAEARIRHDCCGELKDDGHHPMCRHWVEPAEVHPDQEALDL